MDMDIMNEETKNEMIESPETELTLDFEEIQIGDNIEITYYAKKNAYVIKNIDADTEEEIKRENIKPMEKIILAGLLGIPEENLRYVSVEIFAILLYYDNRYTMNKAKEYLEKTSVLVKSPAERKHDMEEISISIKYDLNGLYNNDMTKEERDFIIKEANRLKDAGIAKVKKGVKTLLLKNINSKGKEKNTRRIKHPNEEYTEEYTSLVNGKLLESMRSDFIKGVRKAADKAIYEDNTKKLEDVIDHATIKPNEGFITELARMTGELEHKKELLEQIKYFESQRDQIDNQIAELYSEIRKNNIEKTI